MLHSDVESGGAAHDGVAVEHRHELSEAVADRNRKAVLGAAAVVRERRVDGKRNLGRAKRVEEQLGDLRAVDSRLCERLAHQHAHWQRVAAHAEPRRRVRHKQMRAHQRVGHAALERRLDRTDARSGICCTHIIANQMRWATVVFTLELCVL